MNLNESIMKKFNLKQNVIKKTYVFFISFLFLLFSCESDDGPSVIKVKGVTLDNTEDFKLKVGDTRDLGATIDPDNAANQKVTYNSSSYDVARVSNSGKVTALSAGTAIISVTTKDGAKKAEATVTVTKRIVLAEGINFVTPSPIKLILGDEDDGAMDLSLFTKVTPANATDKNITWKSSKEAKAAVDKDGKVTSVAEGKTVITATAGTASASIDVEVVAEEEVVPDVTGLEFDPAEINLMADGDKNLRSLLTVLPEGANQEVIWESANTHVAKVDAKTGLLEAKNEGTVVITATSVEDSTKSKTITVTVGSVLAESVVVSSGAESVLIGEFDTYRIEPSKAATTSPAVAAVVSAVTLKATVSPSNAGKEVTWAITEYLDTDTGLFVKVDDTATSKGKAAAIAEVTRDSVGNGVVKAAEITTSIPEPLKVKVQATSKDSSEKVSKEVIVIVSYATKEIKIDKGDSISGVIGAIETLTTTFDPVTPTNKKLKWTSKDPTIATVDQKGKVVFIKKGKTTITVEVDTEGGKTESDIITVNVYAVPLNGITIKSVATSGTNVSSGFAKKNKHVVKVANGDLTLTLEIGGTEDLELLPVPSSSEIVGEVVWGIWDGSAVTTTSDKVTVNTRNGLVKGKKVTAASSEIQIVAQTKVNGSVVYTSAPVKVRVVAAIPTSVTISAGEYIQLIKGSGIKDVLKTTVLPSSASQTVDWDITGYFSSATVFVPIAGLDANTSPSLASVNTAIGSIVTLAAGKITPSGEGKVVLTATATEGTTSKIATIIVEVLIPVTVIGDIVATAASVIKAEADNDKLFKLTLGGSVLELSVPTTPAYDCCSCELRPTHPLKWSSNKISVATVDEDGVVTAVSAGEAKISVSKSAIDLISTDTKKSVIVKVE